MKSETTQARVLGTLDPIVGILQEAGYTVAVGAENVQRMIRVAADESTEPLCSGYRVFPDGTRCGGCSDCNPNDLSEGSNGGN